VSGDTETDSELFCCSYEEGGRSPSDLYKRHPLEQTRRFLCVASGEDISHGFRNVSLPNKPNDGRRVNPYDKEGKAKAHEGSLYMEYTSFMYIGTGLYTGFNQRIFAQMEVFKLSPVTMTLESIANITGDQNMGAVISGSGPACDLWVNLITTGLAAIAVFPAAVWLMNKKQIPAGSVPFVIMVFAVLCEVANDDFAIAFGLVASVVASASLLGVIKAPSRLFDRERLIWIYYAMVCLFSAWDWDIYFDRAHIERARFDGISGKTRLEVPWWSFLILSTFVGVLLNHPVLQSMGWIGGTVLVCFGMFGSLLARADIDDYDYYDRTSYGKLWMVPAGLIVGCGLVALGEALTKYRAYVAYYLKTLWRATADATRAGRGGGDSMTTGLLSHRDV